MIHKEKFCFLGFLTLNFSEQKHIPKLFNQII